MNKTLKTILQFSSVIGFTLFLLFVMDSSALAQFTPPSLLPTDDASIGGRGDVCIGLASMIKSGKIGLRNIPCFIKFFTETLIGLAGSLSVVFVMIGGYKYVILGDEKKDEAKKTITYALIGLAVSLLAWVIVDLVLQITTE